MNTRQQNVIQSGTYSPQDRIIQAITSVYLTLKSMRQGDAVFLDIDDTLLLPGLNIGNDHLPLTEVDLPTLIKQLRASRIRVIGLTARQKSLNEITVTQLNQHGLILDEIIHAPSKTEGATKISTKGEALSDYLNRLSTLPKRVIVIDDELLNLLAIQGLPVTLPLLLYHYQRPQKQAIAHHEALFPVTLENYTAATLLGGGTASTYKIESTHDGNLPLVLKFGTHPNQIKLEILFNRLYHAMGVPIPQQAVYNTLPKHLAKKLKQQTDGIYQVSEFIHHTSTNQDSDDLLIRETAKKHFIAHVLLGNIDATKEDNYLVCHDTVYLIDTGANFIFRAKGEPRTELPSLLTELNSLRDQEKNKNGSEWFASLNKHDIQQQVIHLAKQKDQLEKVIWETANQLKLPDDLQLQVLQGFADRLDILITRYCPMLQSHPMRDKPAIPGTTSAGVLTYAYLDDQAYVLLAKRVNHQWFDCFGGKSDLQDGRLVQTACREVAEESSKQFNYTASQLDRSPFHDQITYQGKSTTMTLYRMYLCAHPFVDPVKFKDKEHSDYTWVPISQLITAIEQHAYISEEDQQTITVTCDTAGKNIILFPPFYELLQEAAVLRHFKQLLNQKPLSITHTQSITGGPCLPDTQSNPTSRPFSSPAERQQQIASTLVNHSLFMRMELKPRLHSMHSASDSVIMGKITELSPSEMHLKVVLGARYQHNNHQDNVRAMLSSHYRFNLTSGQMDKLTSELVSLIINEKNNPQDIYLYHACNTEVTFLYTIYTMLYACLTANPALHVFRVKFEIFDKFKHINDLIAHYSQQGSRNINDNEEGYHEAAISTNLFLFGNHEAHGECSINYFVENFVIRPIDLSAVLRDLLQPLSIPDALINRLVELHALFKIIKGNALYQIHIPIDQARDVVYPAGAFGVMNALDQEADLGKIITTLKDSVSSQAANLKTSEYIKSLQARYFASPKHTFPTKQIHWTALSKQEKDPVAAEKCLDQQLDDCINQIVYTLLSVPDQPTSIDHHSPLLRAKKVAFQQSGLTMPTNNSEERLMKSLLMAFVKKDIPAIKQLLTSNPALKNKPITAEVSTSYFNYAHSISIDSKKPFMFIIETWLPDASNINLITTIYSDSLVEIFNEAAESALDLSKVLVWVPSDMRLAIANKYAVKVQNANDLRQVLCLLLNKDCLVFATAHQDKIQDHRQLISILRVLPHENRYVFATAHQNTINGIGQLISVLECLPDKDSLVFASAHQDKIQGIMQLIPILKCLPDKDRLAFASGHQDKIEDIVQLTSVLECLPDKDRFDFAKAHQNIIQNCKQLALVLFHLPDKDQIILANAHQDKIQNGAQLADVLCFLPTQDCLVFAKAHQGKIQGAEELAAVLRVLPHEDCLDFAKTHQDKIQDGDHVLSIVSALPDKDRLVFAIAHQDKIPDRICHYAILCCLPDKNRLTYALTKAYHDKIRDSSIHFGNVLAQLPGKDHITFAKAHQDKIQNGIQLTGFLRCLISGKERFTFAQAFQDIIQDDHQLLSVASCLLNEDRIAFVTSYQDKIKNGATSPATFKPG